MTQIYEMKVSRKYCSSDKQAFTPHFNDKTYSIQCRLCRQQLLVSKKIKFSHQKSKEGCGNCIFLDEELLPEWIQDEIENTSWTKGRLKCPRVECTARVGGFDFIQGLLCGCGEFNKPAIWIQDGKVDVKHMNSDNVMPKKETSFTSSSQPHSKQMAQLDFNRSVCGRALGETWINDALTLKQSGLNDNVNDTNTSEDMPNLSKAPFHQYIGDNYDLGFAQSVDNNNDVTEIESGGLVTSFYTTLSPPQLKIKHAKNKINPCKMSLMPDQINFELDTKISSNRFSSLAIEEPPVKNTSDNIIFPHKATEDHLICAVCLDYFYKPYQCPCSHIFCESCLRQLYHNRAGDLKCPICRCVVKYIEPANEVQEEIHKLPNPGIRQRKVFEKTAKYRKWPLPPIGPLPFLRKKQTLVPSQDKHLVKLASILLLLVCCIILYILS